MDQTTQSAQTSHWIAWLRCYLKRISMPRWRLWPLLCKTANRWNRWVAVWYFVVGSEHPLNGAHFITLQITIHWPLNTHRCKLSLRTMLLRVKYCLILLLKIKALSSMLSCSPSKRRIYIIWTNSVKTPQRKKFHNLSPWPIHPLRYEKM